MPLAVTEGPGAYAFSPNGETLAAGYDGGVLVWDVRLRRRLGENPGSTVCKEFATRAAFQPRRQDARRRLSVTLLARPRSVMLRLSTSIWNRGRTEPVRSPTATSPVKSGTAFFPRDTEAGSLLSRLSSVHASQGVGPSRPGGAVTYPITSNMAMTTFGSWLVVPVVQALAPANSVA